MTIKHSFNVKANIKLAYNIILPRTNILKYIKVHLFSMWSSCLTLKNCFWQRAHKCFTLNYNVSIFYIGF